MPFYSGKKYFITILNPESVSQVRTAALPQRHHYKEISDQPLKLDRWCTLAYFAASYQRREKVILTPRKPNKFVFISNVRWNRSHSTTENFSRYVVFFFQADHVAFVTKLFFVTDGRPEISWSVCTRQFFLSRIYKFFLARLEPTRLKLQPVPHHSIG